MVRLREIPRTAAFAWSPGAASPLIATGTKAGAVDIDFSNETCLELWDLALDGPTQSQGSELKPSAKVPTEAGFNDLAWTQYGADSERGIVAGGLEDGSLSLWNADQLLAGDESSLVSSTKKHSGAIKALQFNPKLANLVATGGAKGELYITNLDDVSSPTRLGSTAARADDIDCLDWNKKVAHIMVTGSSGGFVTVWDMKTKKESLTLNNMGRRAVSAVAWDPEKPTRLMTAIPLEQEPLILIWDLRNANAPERTLRGHESGILSLAWCAQDNDLLLSCGKDNRTICWNPQTGQALGDFPVVTNWTFQTRWNPHNPNLFATASFDGRLSVQTLQNTNPAAGQDSGQGQALDGEDFFSKAQTQPQTSSFSLPQTPKWMETPVSASFGFGGRIVSVRPSEPGASRASKIEIVKFEVDSSVGASTDTFEQVLKEGNLTNVCESRLEEAKSDKEKADWKVIQTLTAENPRKELVGYLGFNETEEAADGLAKLGLTDKQEDAAELNVNGTSAKGHKRFSSMFESTPDGDFLSELAATKGTKTNNPFQIFTGNESESDRRVTRALMLGEFEQALDVCLQENRMDDAFMIAICGGASCIQKAQEAYFSKQSGGPNYLRLLASVVGKNLWDVVHNADLENWKEVMATLCTFADQQEFADLCEALGDRLEEQQQSQKDACFCFLAGSKLEKVVSLWLAELREHEDASATEATDGSAFSIHAKGLQNFIEKVTVFRQVTGYQDNELSKTSDWKLDQLYAKYLEYADIIASHGQLTAAERYLSLVPSEYPGAEVARSRIKQATKTSSTSTTSSTAQPLTGKQKPLPPIGGYQPAQSNLMAAPQGPSQPAPVPQQQPANSYMPPGSAAPQNPYAPQQPAQPQNPYAPAGNYQAQQPRAPGMPAPPQFGGLHSGPMPPPPRASNQSPAVPPPSRATNMSNWNDIPDDFAKAPTPRRGTPNVVPPPAGTAYHASQPSMPPQSPFPPPTAPLFGAAQRATPPAGPPPRGAGPPPMATSPRGGGPPRASPAPNQSASSASSAYAPLPQARAGSPAMGLGMMQPPVPRGPSPYNAPPSNVPPPNRYAPAPGSQQFGPPQPSSRPSMPPPPPQASPYQAAGPPSNPYAPSPPMQQQAAASSPYGQGPPMQQQAAASNTYGQGPPMSAQATPSATSAPPQQPSRPNTAQSERKPTKPPSKYPSGDRSHIPTSGQPIYTILSSEFNRIQARAPSSYKAHVTDVEKRLNILYDHLNNKGGGGDDDDDDNTDNDNDSLIKDDTMADLVQLCQALEARDFETASALQTEIHRDKTDQCGNWMVGLKRLITMAKATPP